MGPKIDTRLYPSGFADGSSSKTESRPDSIVPPKAETEGDTGPPPCRRPNEEREPERIEFELTVCIREWADGREELDPERIWERWEDMGTEAEECE